MRLRKTFIGVFLATFWIGFVFVPKTNDGKFVPVVNATALPEINPTPPVEGRTNREVEEPIEWEEEDASKFKVKLLETGDGFHGDIDKKLFLSSPAEKGKLVKYVAGFWTNGC